MDLKDDAYIKNEDSRAESMKNMSVASFDSRNHSSMEPEGYQLKIEEINIKNEALSDEDISEITPDSHDTSEGKNISNMFLPGSLSSN